MTADISPTVTRKHVCAFVGAQLVIYLGVYAISRQFEYTTPGNSRPILTTLLLFAAASGLHLVALRAGVRLPDTRSLSQMIIAVAVLMRGILLLSTPIQEVDIYRYIWDGIVISQGVSPYRFTPIEVLNASDASNEQLHDLDVLVQSDPGVAEVLHRVHFPSLTTVYPPVSQAVFAFAATITPRQSTLAYRVLSMKVIIVGFDIASVVLIYQLLRTRGQHSAWLIPYSWSPLVLKEFANSGHLDSIAVCLTLAATLNMLCIRPKWQCPSVMGSAVLAGLGVGAKLYPIMLYPLWVVFILKNHGMRIAAMWSALAVIVAAASVSPMLVASYHHQQQEQERVTQNSIERDGLSTFLTRWEMNDLLFMVVEENIRSTVPTSNEPTGRWFVVIPTAWRMAFAHVVHHRIGIDSARQPFMLTRALGAMLSIILTAVLCRVVWHSPARILEAMFLSLAWLWFLAPTQNPWYWIWALAFAPFATNRLWLIVSTLTLVYYLRFWFLYFAPNTPILGTSMVGAAFFDFVVVWIEFGPFLALLAASSLSPSLRRRISCIFAPGESG